MRFPQSFIEEVLNRSRLSEIVGRTVQLAQAGKEMKGRCPFHNEKSGSFYVNDSKGVYNCFGCGAGGNIFDFIQKTQNLSFPESIEMLAKDVGLQVPEYGPEDSKEDIDQLKRLYEMMKVAGRFFHDTLFTPPGLQARSYADKRGLSLPVIKRFGLGYAPSGSSLQSHLESKGYNIDEMAIAGLMIKPEEAGKSPYPRFRNRLMFPIFDRQSRVIGFGGRAFGDAKPKYLNSPETPLFKKRSNLYGLNFVKKHNPKNGPVIICEGYMDAIALHQAGFFGAVAPLGTALTEQQLRSVWQMTDTPFVCFDGDEAGLKAAERTAQVALPILSPGKTLKICLLPEGEDPDSLIQRGGKTAFQDLLSRSLDLGDFIWQTLLKQFGLSTPAKKAALLDEISKTSDLIQDQKTKSAYASHLKSQYYDTLKSGKSHTPNVLTLKSTPVDFETDALFASLINHPELIEEYFEDLMHIDFKKSAQNELRDTLIESIETETLNQETLVNYLNNNGFDRYLAQILSPKTYQMASFCRANTDISVVKEAINKIINKKRSGTVEKSDLHLAINDLQKNMTKEAWERIKALKSEKEALNNASRDVYD